MAFTLTQAQQTVFGNQRVLQGTVTADNTSGYVDSGFDSIYHAMVCAKTQTSGCRIRINSLPSGTATAGYLAFSSVTSGDVFYVTIYGR